MVVTSSLKPKKKKKDKLEEHVGRIAEEEKPLVEEAEEKIGETTLPQEEIKYMTEEKRKPEIMPEAAPSGKDVSYILHGQEQKKEGYKEAKAEEKTALRFKSEHAAEPGREYTDVSALKAGLPRKGYVESKGLLKDAMLEELKKKHEEETKKEHEQRMKKLYKKDDEE
jgi:hypothetical protein